MSGTELHSPKSKWIRCISASGTLRGLAIEATDLVQAMVDLHGLEGEHAQYLGEATIAGLMLASGTKPGERINLNIQGDGHEQVAIIDAYPNGKLRGYSVPRERTRVSSAVLDSQIGPWGAGLLSVLRTKGTEGEQPYIGTVPLVTGHLAKDLTFYYFQSEQIPTALGILVLTEGKEVRAAGGFLVQVLPGATQAEITDLERHATDMGGLAVDVLLEKNPTALLGRLFQEHAFQILEERELGFRCECSAERVERAIALVGVFELASMLEHDKGASVRCDFCAKDYKIPEKRLSEILEQATARAVRAAEEKGKK
jgi:molecular chaperone Hsp33